MIRRGDAFLLALIPCEIGIPYVGLARLDQVATQPTVSSTLLARVKSQSDGFRARAVDVLRQVKDVETLLKRSNLTVPHRPTGLEDYQLWTNSIRRVVGDAAATGTPEQVCHSLGLHVGDIFQGIALEVLMTWLLECAPNMGFLLEGADVLSTRVNKALPQLEQLIREHEHNGSLPDQAVRIGLRIPIEVRAAPPMEASASVGSRMAGLRAVMQRLMQQISELRLSLEGLR